jgi:hypothetical protein
MFEELKKIGITTATQRATCGLLAAGGLFAIFFFNIFGVEGNARVSFMWVTVVVCSLVTVSSIANLAMAANTNLMKGIEKYAQKSPDPHAAMVRLESTWREGLDFKSGRIDKEYIICLQGMRSIVIPLENAVWVCKRAARNYTYSTALEIMMVCFRDGKPQSCRLQGDAISMIFSHIMENCPHIAVGHENKLEKLYQQKDLQGIREYARIQRARAGEAELWQ